MDFYGYVNTVQLDVPAGTPSGSDAAIYQMTPEGIHKVKYKETDTYRLYKGFLDNPEQMTSILLGDEND